MLNAKQNQTHAFFNPMTHPFDHAESADFPKTSVRTQCRSNKITEPLLLRCNIYMEVAENPKQSRHDAKP